jgi:hypothetical protein
MPPDEAGSTVKEEIKSILASDSRYKDLDEFRVQGTIGAKDNPTTTYTLRENKFSTEQIHFSLGETLIIGGNQFQIEDPIAEVELTCVRDGAEATETIFLRSVELDSLKSSEFHLDPTTGNMHFIPSAKVTRILQIVPCTIWFAVVSTLAGNHFYVPLSYLDKLTKVKPPTEETTKDLTDTTRQAATKIIDNPPL